MSIEDFINGIPKAELHVHIEGTFEPELILKLPKGIMHGLSINP